MLTEVEFAKACRAINVDLIPSGIQLTTDTLPAAIATDQLAAVQLALPVILAAWRSVDCEPTDAQLAQCVSDDIDLPTWVCWRRLAELGITASPPSVLTHVEKRTVGTDRVQKIISFLRALDRFASALEIAKGTGLTKSAIRNALHWEMNPFRKVAAPGGARRYGYVYQVREFRTKQAV